MKTREPKDQRQTGDCGAWVLLTVWAIAVLAAILVGRGRG